MLETLGGKTSLHMSVSHLPDDSALAIPSTTPSHVVALSLQALLSTTPVSLLKSTSSVFFPILHPSCQLTKFSLSALEIGTSNSTTFDLEEDDGPVYFLGWTKSADVQIDYHIKMSPSNLTSSSSSLSVGTTMQTGTSVSTTAKSDGAKVWGVCGADELDTYVGGVFSGALII